MEALVNSECFFFSMRLILLYLVLIIPAFNVAGQSAVEVLKSAPRPMICGHRGGFYTDYPENSLQVMQSVIEKTKRQPLLLEVDIRKSKDGTLYILHDETVDRTTSGTGKLSELEDKYIDGLYLKRSTGELSSQKILRLTDLLDSLQNESVWLMLDIKEDVWIETTALIIRKEWHKRSVFLTFKPTDTQRLYNYSHQLIVSALLRNETDWEALKKLAIPSKGLIAYILRDASSQWSDQLKNAGFTLMADASEHTTNKGQWYPAAYYNERVRKNNLDILITDFPVEVAAILK